MMIVLCAIAALTGILAAWVIRRTAGGPQLTATIRRAQAYLMEFRLFFDDPRLVWRAQLNLIRENLRILARLLPGTLLLALPISWLIVQLNGVYGVRPLHAGETAVITARLAPHVEARGKGGVRVETPPVKVPRENLVAWRIRADAPGAVICNLDGETITRTIAFEDAQAAILGPSALRVAYPKSDSAISWEVWFAAASTLAAVVFTRRGS